MALTWLPVHITSFFPKGRYRVITRTTTTTTTHIYIDIYPKSKSLSLSLSLCRIGSEGERSVGAYHTYRERLGGGGWEGRGGKGSYFNNNNNSSSKTVLGMCIRQKDPRTRVLGLSLLFVLLCFQVCRVGQGKDIQKIRVWGKGREG